MKNLQTLMVVLVAFLLAAKLRFGSLELAPFYLVALLTGLLLTSVIMPATGAFRAEFRWDFLRKTRRLIAGWALVIMSLVTIAAMLKVTSIYSRIWFGSWVLIGAGLLFTSLALDIDGERIAREHDEIGVLTNVERTGPLVEIQHLGPC